MNFKVTFHLDGSGVYLDPADPIHLDALLAWCLAGRQGVKKHLQRGDVPEDVRLPLLRSTVHGNQVWHASALFPDGERYDGLQFWRKRFRVGRIDLTSGSPNLTNGPYRDWNQPCPLVLVRRMVAYASGNRREVKRLLTRELRYLGKKRAHGHGRIAAMELDPVDRDMSLVSEGVAMRWLPHPEGGRLVRPAPPYWNTEGRVPCLEVGQKVPDQSRNSFR